MSRAAHTDAPAQRCWRFSAAQVASSPSAADGLSYAEEQRLRRASCAHMLETIRLVIDYCCRLLPEAERAPERIEERARLPASTAFVLFHRFYMRHSFLRHDRFVRCPPPPPLARARAALL